MNQHPTNKLEDFAPEGVFQEDVNRLNSALLRHTAFIFYSSRFKTPNLLVSEAGTASLLRVGCNDMVVTCEHVFAKFEEIRREDPQALLGIGVCYGVPLLELRAPELRIRARCESLDLIAFDYPQLEHHSNHTKAYLDLADFADVELSAGETIVFTGFPKSSREEQADRVFVDAPPLPFEITDISDKTLHVVATGDNREVFGSIGEAFGGYSGSLAFAFKHGRYVPVGIVKEWSRLLDGHIKIVRIGCLLRLLSHTTP